MDANQTVVIGSPGDVRVLGFQAALGAQGRPPADVVSYTDLIAGRVSLPDVIRPGAWVRIESPGKSAAAQAALLRLGADQPDHDGDYARLPGPIPQENGLILAPRQWYLGLRALLDQVRDALAVSAPHHLMNHTDDIALMFDKRACHAHLLAHGVEVPPALAPVCGYDELIAHLDAENWRQVFVKLAHGSSASGVVALRRHVSARGERMKAITTVEMVTSGSQTKLFNTRRIRSTDSPAEIARLVNALARHRVHVEQWIPKARLEGHTFDLRVVVIGGRARHVIARLSHSPMTNLHLLNQRRDAATVRAALGPERFAAAMSLAEHALSAFPRSLYAGVDLLISHGKRRQLIIEVNAFGDLLHNTWHDGLNTYESEIQWMTNNPART